ncbi:MAG: hypothetical protein EAZ07_04865 [Cytophagales bacterium]|nr:MAG: hypothetical protein EAZ07_04865 [Cytophagales bacterium]
MGIFNAITKLALSTRVKQIERFIAHPHEVQQRLLFQLLKHAQNTQVGKQYGFSSIKSIEDFRNKVPKFTYEEIFPLIDKMMRGESNVLWPGRIRWFSKSSGTTNDKSKFIPVSTESLHDCHYKGGKDLIALYFHNNPSSKMFDGKGLAIGGSYKNNNLFPDSYYGDVSAVIMANLPKWAGYASTPDTSISLMSEWEEKLERISNVTIGQNVTNISGVPTWTMVLLEKILEKTKKENMLEVWPNFEVFFHGAVAFHPYKELFYKLFPKKEVRYMETYNASEGFFAMQDQFGRDDMLLMLDNGVYYEFIPANQSNAQAIGLAQVALNTNYIMLITTNGGLWRYQIGDTIKFTSLYPHRIKITGRTKHFINAFGEELIIENAESAIASACEYTGSKVVNFTAAPLYMDNQKKGAHEWVIEFLTPPESIEQFADILDQHLQKLNSDYESKRYKSYVLLPPVIHVAPQGTFYQWMKSRNKIGAQNKVPRLANDRTYIDDILEKYLIPSR